jgi:iduronate 2-sulfatase
LPQHFKNNGYVTRAVGKVYHEGINDVQSWSAPHETNKAPRYGPEATARQKARVEAARKAGMDLSDPKKRPKGPAWEAPDLPDNQLMDGANCARAMEILREIQAKPFFMAVGFSNPHIPYVAPKKYWDLYDPARIRLVGNQPPPKDAPRWALNNLGEVQQYLDVPKQDPLPEATQRKLFHGYLAATSYVDAQIGRLLATLDELGVRDNTIVVLWGDNGYQLGEHGWWSNKHTNYETSVRCPLLVSVPGQKTAGQQTAALTEFMDIYPSLTGLCGLPAMKSVEGHSFAPLLEQPDRPWKKAAFSAYLRGSYMGLTMRTDRYRLVEWTKKGEPTVYELYDHQTDPGENVNVAGIQTDLVKQLAAQLRAGWTAALP